LSQSLLAAGGRHGSVDFQQDTRPGIRLSCPDDISSSKAAALFKSFAASGGDNAKGK
jgi:hypothetical protein